jgi:hypothetical protein
MDVLTAAWIGSGAPVTDRATAGLGACARCGTAGDLVPARSVISRSFTGFDGWLSPAGPGLCRVCSWGYATAGLRAGAHLITRTPATVQALTRDQAGAVLTSPLAADRALVVPLRPGRKHVLPDAVWGRVSVDDAHLPWGEHDAALLQLVIDLRGKGFGSRMLAEPAPPYPVLQTLPRGCWRPVLQAWEQLASWRAPDSPWLPLALHVTLPTSDTAAGHRSGSSRRPAR